jgi:hypothetical protein
MIEYVQYCLYKLANISGYSSTDRANIVRLLYVSMDYGDGTGLTQLIS